MIEQGPKNPYDMNVLTTHETEARQHDSTIIDVASTVANMGAGVAVVPIETQRPGPQSIEIQTPPSFPAGSATPESATPIEPAPPRSQRERPSAEERMEAIQAQTRASAARASSDSKAAQTRVQGDQDARRRGEERPPRKRNRDIHILG